MHSLMQFLSCVDYVSSSEKVGICDVSFVWIALSGGGSPMRTPVAMLHFKSTFTLR